MHMQIARALLEGTYSEVSAIVSLNEREEVLAVSLLNTEHPEERLCFAEGAKEIRFISNHPEGNQTPYKQDIVNYRALVRRAGGRTVRLFLSSEYFACIEIKGIGSEDAYDIMDETLY